MYYTSVHFSLPRTEGLYIIFFELYKMNKTKKDDQIEINIPTSGSILTPIAILIGFAMIAGAILFAGDKITKEISAQGKTTQNTEVTQQVQDKIEITEKMIDSLFDQEVVKFGNKNAKLTFIEVSDPSCPYCHVGGGYNPELASSISGGAFTYTTEGGSYTPPMQEIEKLVKDGKASFVYLYSNGHGRGEVAAQALYCAYENDKFFEVNAELMSNEGYKMINDTNSGGNTMKPEVMAEFLKDTIDYQTMYDCLNSGEYKTRLAKDQALADSLGAKGTPAYIVNTQLFSGAQDYSKMSSLVDSILK